MDATELLDLIQDLKDVDRELEFFDVERRSLSGRRGAITAKIRDYFANGSPLPVIDGTVYLWDPNCYNVRSWPVTVLDTGSGRDRDQRHFRSINPDIHLEDMAELSVIQTGETS